MFVLKHNPTLKYGRFLWNTVLNVQHNDKIGTLQHKVRAINTLLFSTQRKNPSFLDQKVHCAE